MSMPSLRDALDQRFVELIRGDRVRVPPYPAAAARLQAILSRDEWSLQEVAQVVASDSVLAVATLRRANAADQGSRPTTSVAQAVSRIGSRAIISLALSIGLAAEASRPGALRGLRRMVWRQSLLSAELCAMLAAHRGLPIDDGFVCGLLHDFGKVAALACLETIVAGQATAPALSAARCLQCIEAFHVELGVVMVGKWQLPDQVARVITEHHGELGRSTSPLTELVMVADQVVELLDLAPSVTRHDLAQIAGIRDVAEQQFIAHAVLGLPQLIAPYDDIPAAASWGRAPTEPTPSTLRGTPMAMSLPALCRAAELRTVAVASDGAVLRGRVPLDEQDVAPVSIETPLGPLEFFATITRCVPEGIGFEVEVKPLALAPRAQERWDALLASAA